ncbi:DUF1156 domain-containing protein [Rhodococcus aetherivorans]|uniref:DUF1156 domain-containing protein n=1 Tax=Rhodococcus aetherivorans TaxID=191292 RepID=UPI0002D24967|nr:DUF1156 domain-containing protein [Rhodococcus aetherivorans]CCW13720.1 Adenine-specific DNA methylase containing a Zn-ribbon [Rhodococcus aetherivorans]
MHKPKLIEVALPLEAINRESAREKSIRHGHPSTLHLWWARRPLAAARAVLFAQLVDDPSARPDEFPTEELQRKERERLHGIIERLVVWENVRDERLMEAARQEILRSTNGKPPAILDPFAGGGTIPLEAQRLGLDANASDLNPVAVLINKALIEIPPNFRDQPPVFPGLADSEIRGWNGAQGLAADVRAYGQWMRDEADQRIGRLYPKVTLADGSLSTVIAWIWVRTVTCPNPACGLAMPLAGSWWLSKKKGKEVYVVPEVVGHELHAHGRQVRYSLGTDPRLAPSDVDEGTVGRRGAICIGCQAPVKLQYLRDEGRANRLGSEMIGVVAEGSRQRHYLAPDRAQQESATVDPPADTVTGSLGYYPRDLKAPTYGLTEFTDLFSARQLVGLTTFCDLVGEARARAISDGASVSYADALATYLGLTQSKMANLSSTITTWMSDRGAFRETFARQAIPMTWDYAEANVLSDSGGGWITFLDKTVRVIEQLPCGRGKVTQADASSRSFAHTLLSTDPPYYDNIGYSDLSDYFYTWLRRSLRPIYPDLLSTISVPKAEELVANPYRHDGKQGARQFFEDGFRRVFANARETAETDYPITVYYAFKQAESDANGEASTGWETLLEGMIRAGWEITSTWPVRTEGAGRLLARDKNALASSIVLSLRPRTPDAPTTDRRGFIAALESELPNALRKLQQGLIAPVDLPQAAIGPGMSVFSRYAAVLEPDGKKMSVRAALSRINEVLDQVLNEQEGDFDATSRFAVAWYRQYGYGVGKFGDADNLARARNTSVDAMDRAEILTSRAGNVQLVGPAHLSWDYDVLRDLNISNWEALHHLIKVLERDGIAPAGDFLQAALSRPDGAVDPDLVKELAHLLFRIAEGHGWTKDAISFNTLVTSWPEILEVARSVKKPVVEQGSFDFDEGDD